ncbi:MAG: regulator of cell morphogenesis and NO signaling [Planctomycetota bacterium]|jgi:regulator of cell morphogenesis and NO signaling
MQPSTQPLSQRTLADLAVADSTATRVFHQHGLDFCCGGRVSLADACKEAGLDVAQVSSELEAAAALSTHETSWAEAPLNDLVQHLLDRFHADHREELPRLIAMAEKVESVHAEKPDCPKGLAKHLAMMMESLEDHMQKEEQILFPAIEAGRGPEAAMPVRVMESEHRDHGLNLERLAALAHGYEPPADACNTWTALYLGLKQLQEDLMQHIHLENNVLFPRALTGER